MTLRRRAFLQRACGVLAGFGLSDAVLSRLGTQYYQALAQPTRRKLALLVGIDQYPGQPALQGCGTDLDLQQELLQHRFGFQAADILVLRDQQATRKNIETAFLEHLQQQARPDDVVVFHFSGYGRQVHFQEEENNPRLALDSEQNVLVPVDDGLTDASSSAGAVSVANVLLEDTLFLLLRSLATDQVTTVLDTSYVYPGSRILGGLRVRSQAPLKPGRPSEAEFAFQEQLLQRADMSREQVQVQRRSNQIPGLVLSAAGLAQLAMEAQWPGFDAGLFTYALTQHLWTATPATTIWTSCSQVATDLQQWVGQNQQPALKGQQSRHKSLLPYNLITGGSADGVITAIADGGQTAELWLAGLPASILKHYHSDSLLRAVSAAPAIAPKSAEETGDQQAIQVTPASDSFQSAPLMQVQSRQGLTAKAKLIGTGELQPGQYLREVLRVLSRGVGLTIALDSNLERIERVDATSAFSGIERVGTANAGEPADFLFARAQQVSPVQVNQSQATDGPWHVLVSDPSQLRHSYGLFFLGDEPIPNTIGESGESVKTAVRRLVPKLQTLLAAKLLNLSENASTSRLGVRATLETIAPSSAILSQQQTCRAPWKVPAVPAEEASSLSQEEKEGGPVTVPIGTRIQYRLQNYSDRPVYLTLLKVDASATAFAYYSPAIRSDQPEIKLLLKNEVIEPQDSLLIPHQSNSFEWMVRGPTGLTTTYLLLSRNPFNRTLAALETVMRQSQSTDGQQIAPLPNVLDVVQEVLQDLTQASSDVPQAGEISGDRLALDVDNWATLRFTYRVI